jgi:apolipoprotein N-acyltransferase
MTALAAGVAAVFSLPPFSILAFVPASYGVLYLLVRDRRPGVACVLGWFHGLGYFGVGLSWIAESFTVDAERFGVLALPAVAGLSAVLAFFPALATGLFVLVVRRRTTSELLAAVLFAMCWAGAEWLRGHILTGFPWNLPAYALSDYAALRQSAAWIGSYGLTLLVVLAGVLLAQAAAARGASRRTAFLFFGLVVGGLWGVGEVRLAQPAPASPDVSLRIVQGNVPQRVKWDSQNREPTLSRYLALSRQRGPVDIVLWPETAYPGFVDENDQVRRRIAAALPEGSVLLTGAPDRTVSEGRTFYFNTIQAYDSAATALTSYAKHHLVPFGEYVPLPGWLPLERMTEGLGDFTPGSGPRTLAMAALPTVAPAICYEIIFPGHVVSDTARPDWIFNATNDAWFGTSIGPEQHLASARMRAVEEGLPVIRAANTGISAVIDAYGRLQATLDLEETGVIDASLPPSLPRTLYARAGDWVLLPLGLALWLIAGGGQQLADRQARRDRCA